MNPLNEDEGYSFDTVPTTYPKIEEVSELNKGEIVEKNNLPKGEMVENENKEALSKFVTGKLLEISNNKKPEMFSREDILGNIEQWENNKLQCLHRLQKMCNFLNLGQAQSFFQKKKRKF